MRFRDRIKGRPQSKNVIDARTPAGLKKHQMASEAMSNPRTLSPEPIEYNNEKNNKDRAKGAMGSVMRNDPKQVFRRTTTNKDAQFFKHTIKDK